MVKLSDRIHRTEDGTLVLRCINPHDGRHVDIPVTDEQIEIVGRLFAQDEARRAAALARRAAAQNTDR